MDESGGRQFKDFAGYLWEAFEVKGREAGVPPGFRRIFFRSVDHPQLPPVPGPITTAPLQSLSVEQLRGFIKLGHAFPQAEGGRAQPAAPTSASGGDRASGRQEPVWRNEWESFLDSVASGPGSQEPVASTSPLPSTGSEPRGSASPGGPVEPAEEGLYPGWLEEALRADEGYPGPEGGPAGGGNASEGEAPWEPQAPVHRRHLYRGFESARLIPHRFQARVRVGLRDEEFVGEAEGADVPGARVEVAARATLVALQKAEGNRVELALQGAKVVRAFDRSVVVVGVYGLKERDVTFLVGASLARDSIEHAAILATLQATGRWLAWAASRKRNGAHRSENPPRPG